MSIYQENLQRAEAQLNYLRTKINRFAFARLLVLLGGSALLFQLVRTESVWAVVLGFLMLVLCFSWLVYWQSKLDREKVRWEAYALINQYEIQLHTDDANTGELSALYSNGALYSEPKHPYSEDLDVFGPSSLYAYSNRCATPEGRARLASWLSGPGRLDEILARQAAVEELREDLEWIQQFQVDLFAFRENQRPLKPLLEFLVANQEASQFGGKWSRVYVYFVPYLLGGLLLGGLLYSSLLTVVLWIGLGNLMATLGLSGRVTKIVGRAQRAGGLLQNFSDSISRIENRDWKSRSLQALCRGLRSENLELSKVFLELSTILDKFDYRLNMLVGALLNMVLVWDFRQVYALQDWQRAHGNSVLNSLDLVGEMESLCSFALLRINHPHWVMPEVRAEEEQILQVKRLAHPLISSGRAVPNDYFNVGHRIALITGSNMAGKSTFLRTVGINAVLALSGAPVCAEQMRISRVHLLTYMRIKDSLQESTSTFKAELDRIKMILDHLQREPNSYFLVDEMLRGTNSVDKYRGSKAIIERFVQNGARGMVATHDLNLAELEEQHPQVVRNFHFDIQVKDGEMLFDYTLKHGACTVFNASTLLKGIGIEVNPNS